MTASGPNVFVTLGNTDCWDLAVPFDELNTELSVDSRLRSIYRNVTSAPVEGVVQGKLVRTADSIGRYAELLVVSGVSCRFGLLGRNSKQPVTSSTVLGSTKTVAYYGSAAEAMIINNGSANQTGLDQAQATSRIGLKYYLDSGTPTVQFYIDGVALGTPETLSSSFDFAVLGASPSSASGSSVTLYVDKEDLLYLPSDCQPWGCSARVSDADGYSPAATKLDANIKTSGATLDSYYRTLTGSTLSEWNVALGDNAVGEGATLVYCEFSLENVIASSATNIGLMLVSEGAPSGANYIGNNAGGWGYLPSSNFGNAGSTYTNASATDTGVTCAEGDRPGLVWDRATGKLWFTKNGSVIGGGDPKAGTSPAYTTTLAEMRVGCGVYSNTGTRIRICTHPYEQKYRPVYCTAWDGGDILPEQHYRGLLGNDPYIEQSVWFPVPWGGSKSGAPIGAIELQNNDGRYDDLANYLLRDESVAMYEVRDDGQAHNLARCVVESIETQGETILRILVGDTLAALQRHVESSVFAVGGPMQYIPAIPKSGAELTYVTTENPLQTIRVFDAGIEVFTWAYTPYDDEAGFRRTINSPGKQTVILETFRPDGTSNNPTNHDFTTWSGDNPTGWTVSENGTTSKITQSGGACHFIRNAGAPACSISQSGRFDGHFLKLTVSEYTSGNVTIDNGIFGVADFDINGPGVYYKEFPTVAVVDSATLTLAAEEGTNLKIDKVEFIGYERLAEPQNAVKYLLEDLGGLSSSAYNLNLSFNEIGFYSTENPAIISVLDELCRSWIAGYYTDNSNVIQFVPLVMPEDYDDTSELWCGAFVEAQLMSAIEVRDDRAPALSSQAYVRNYDVHSEDQLADSVTPADRETFIREGKKNTDFWFNPGILYPFYEFAYDAGPIRWSSLAQNKSEDIITEFDIALDLLGNAYSIKRQFIKLQLGHEDASAVKPGKIFKLTHSRYGMSVGKNWYVVSVRRTLLSPIVEITAWG